MKPKFTWQNGFQSSGCKVCQLSASSENIHHYNRWCFDFRYRRAAIFIAFFITIFINFYDSFQIFSFIIIIIVTSVVLSAFRIYFWFLNDYTDILSPFLKISIELNQWCSWYSWFLYKLHCHDPRTTIHFTINYVFTCSTSVFSFYFFLYTVCVNVFSSGLAKKAWSGLETKVSSLS